MKTCCVISVMSFSTQHSSCSAYIKYISISHLFTARTQHCKKALNTLRIIFTHGTQQLTSHKLYVIVHIQVDHWWLGKKQKNVTDIKCCLHRKLLQK